jgi:CobQ-like glutamine amidotransferase family enzyme
MKPLGKVVGGYGNNGVDGYEGCIYKNTYCTYFHGSLLPKNPELADRFIRTALERKCGDTVNLEQLDDEIEHKAKEFIIQRESKKK